MKAMLLAAGRGERMGELTAHRPKPLLEVAGQTLLSYQIERLIAAGVEEIIINVAYHADMIRAAVDELDSAVPIYFSDEQPAALETAGGIVQALELLGPQPFWLVSCDVITDFSLAELELPPGKQGCLLMVPNPTHHPHGDFGVDERGNLDFTSHAWTFGGMACLDPRLFAKLTPGFRRIRPVLTEAIAAGLLVARCYEGAWLDVGTPERLGLAAQSCSSR
jgi:MurNAc alpha-1-phosphate uridylyltransferase